MDAPGDPVWVRGLRWVESRREEFRIPEGPAGPWTLGPLKAVGELARACSVLLRGAADDALRARLSSLLHSAWTACREGGLFHEILELRPSQLMVGSLYSIFHREGLCHEPTRRLLTRLGQQPMSRPSGDAAWDVREASGIRLASDAPAVLALGLAEGWKAMGLPCRWSTADLVPRTILGRRPQGDLSVDEGYSVAHAVLFATSFGAEPDGLDEATKDWLERRGSSLLQSFLDIPNLDIFAEMVLALACTGRPVAGAPWERILRLAQRADGSLPAPLRRDRDAPGGNETSGGGGPTTTSFRRDYHVTLAAILASFALSRPCARAG